MGEINVLRPEDIDFCRYERCSHGKWNHFEGIESYADGYTLIDENKYVIPM